ncbi:DNA polymerase processivity factor-like protein [Seal parapoxvirus]|uniref:DNA polymerase processivity factor-like protein n=1 Tax=Seal parapoxvirus TaxID=187984 RepID=A0A1Z3GCR4_9POXV|nr:DNA polymerase processivity factor-like protein [Seal parapoxvirus]ASC55549.1 DNA polymerase processivity factor-like protein [Seal parapoxvirus]
MASDSDLYTLKELIKLRDSLHLVTGESVERYNTLVEWANRTYWTVAVAPTAPCASINKYYARSRASCALEPGEYVASRLHFGATHAWVRGTAFNSTSGAEVQPPPEVRAACESLDTKYADLTFVRFSVFQQRWTADDAVADYSASDAILADCAAAGVRVASTLRLAVAPGEFFSREDFDAVHAALRAAGDQEFGTAVCLARPGAPQRRTIDLSQRCFMRVKRVELVNVDGRHYLPVLRTTANNRVLSRGVGHLVDARARPGAFVAVRRYSDCLVLCDDAARGDEASREEALRSIVRCFGPNCAVSDGYVVRVRDIDARGMSSRLGLVQRCETFEDLRAAVESNCSLRQRLAELGAIKMACECMGYPQQEAIALINNMRFQITEDGSVKHFELENASCLGNPTAESIFSSFPQFVSVFNLLSSIIRQ